MWFPQQKIINNNRRVKGRVQQGAGYYAFTRHGHVIESTDERKERGSFVFDMYIWLRLQRMFDRLYYDILVDMRVCYQFGGSGSWSTVKIKASRLRKTCDIGDRGWESFLVWANAPSFLFSWGDIGYEVMLVLVSAICLYYIWWGRQWGRNVKWSPPTLCRRRKSTYIM